MENGELSHESWHCKRDFKVISMGYEFEDIVWSTYIYIFTYIYIHIYIHIYIYIYIYVYIYMYKSNCNQNPCWLIYSIQAATNLPFILHIGDYHHP